MVVPPVQSPVGDLGIVDDLPPGFRGHIEFDPLEVLGSQIREDWVVTVGFPLDHIGHEAFALPHKVTKLH